MESGEEVIIQINSCRHKSHNFAHPISLENQREKELGVFSTFERLMSFFKVRIRLVTSVDGSSLLRVIGMILINLTVERKECLVAVRIVAWHRQSVYDYPLV